MYMRFQLGIDNIYVNLYCPDLIPHLQRQVLQYIVSSCLWVAFTSGYMWVGYYGISIHSAMTFASVFYIGVHVGYCVGGITIHSVMTFASGFYNGVHVGGLLELCYKCVTDIYKKLI
jgi:hypothetical protein